MINPCDLEECLEVVSRQSTIHTLGRDTHLPSQAAGIERRLSDYSICLFGKDIETRKF